MANIDDIYEIIVKCLETANNEEIAEVYRDVVGCGDCPYWSDCKNKHMCFDYVLTKLEE